MRWFIAQCKIRVLELIHRFEWYRWERKWVTVKNGQKNYANWPECHQATPEWKNRVRRARKIYELRKVN